MEWTHCRRKPSDTSFSAYPVSPSCRDSMWPPHRTQSTCGFPRQWEMSFTVKHHGWGRYNLPRLIVGIQQCMMVHSLYWIYISWFIARIQLQKLQLQSSWRASAWLLTYPIWINSPLDLSLFAFATHLCTFAHSNSNITVHHYNYTKSRKPQFSKGSWTVAVYVKINHNMVYEIIIK